jgi:uncharacterized protein involved in exopolysaccharide biosynthesis
VLSGRSEVAGLYLAGLRRWWWLVPTAAFVAGGLAFLVTTRETPTYAAMATAAVAPSREVQDPADVLRSLETLERRTVVATFARMASTDESLERAAEIMGVETAELSTYSVNASVISSTNLIRVRVEGPDAAQAAALANATLVVVEESARELYQLFRIERVEAASVARRPIRPEPVRSVGVAALFGLLLGGSAASVSGPAQRRRSRD